MTGLPEAGELNDLTVAGAPRPSASSYRSAEASTARVGVSRILATVGRWGLLGLVAALAFEVTARVEDWVMYRTPLDSPYQSIEDLTIRDADGMHGRSNARFQRWIMNGLGTRGSEAAVAPAPGTIRVITVGASETFGMRESPNKEYPQQLADSLNARLRRDVCHAPNTRFEVLNAGFAGMSLPTIQQDVRNRLARLHPSIITVYPSPVGYLLDAVPVAARPDSSGRGRSPTLRQALRPRARDRVREQLKLMLPEAIKSRLRRSQIDAVVAAHGQGWRFRSAPADRLSAFEVDLRKVVGAIRSIGATPVLVTHASAFAGRSVIDDDLMTAWEKLLPRATRGTILQFDSLSRATTLRVAADSGIVAVDAVARLSVAPPSAFADAVHFTDLGAAIVAGALADGVLASASLECATR